MRRLGIAALIFAVGAVIIGLLAGELAANWFGLALSRNDCTGYLEEIVEDSCVWIVAGVALASALVAIACAIARRATRRRDRANRREAYLRSGTERIAKVVGESLVSPTTPLLQDHHDARTLALAATDRT